jgi:hypothetical protein
MRAGRRSVSGRVESVDRRCGTTRVRIGRDEYIGGMIWVIGLCLG